MRITTMAASRAKERGAAAAISSLLRSQHERGIDAREIQAKDLDQLISGLPRHSVLDKQAILLRWMSARSTFPGEEVELDANLDYPVAWCSNSAELFYHLNALEQRGLAEVVKSPYLESTTTGAVVTPAGWSHLENERSAPGQSGQAFVAMAFAQELLPAWKDGIQTALAKAGYRGFRTDAQPSIDRIDVQIMSEIRRSSLVVADVTLQRPGVYFEAGYAIGLGIPVYWCVRRDELDKVHFDTRQYNHIVWSTPEDLASQLYNFVYAISGPASAT